MIVTWLSPLQKNLLDALWCLLLGCYALLGMAIAPFHGDEAMLIYASKDFTTAFVEGHPSQLTTHPPYIVDTDPHLRILNGSTMPYLFGLSLYLQGLEAERPTRLWQWGQSYDENVVLGSRPTEAVLQASRWASGLLLVASIGVMFGLGKVIEGRFVAYLASFLYALSPVLLVNGRRANHEGGLLFWGLAVILFTLWMLQGQPPKRYGWLGMGILAGMTLVTKHNGIVYVVIAFGWWLVALLYGYFVGIGGAQPTPPPQGNGFLRLVTAGMVAVGIFIALSPALWSNLPARLRDLLQVRGDLLESQTDSNGATSLGERVSGIITTPYIDPPQMVEVAFWEESDPFRAEVQRYEESWLKGIVWPNWIAVLFTLLAVWGLIGNSLPSIARLGVWIWLGVVTLTLLANPLPWQRYSLPLYPLAYLLSAIGIVSMVKLVRAYMLRPNGD